jgi:cysteine desulfurase
MFGGKFVMRHVYLDNSATTPVLPEVAAAIHDILINNFGNPSSMHRMGVAAERVMTDTRRVLAAQCAVSEQDFFFTSGGTEANNLAVKGVARRMHRRGRHLITTRVEHPSVLYSFRVLEGEGFDVTYLNVDEKGRVSAEEMVAAVRDDTTLVSIMHVNNEVGSIMPVATIGPLIKKKNPATLFHVDAVQSFGKLPVSPGAWQADLLTLSAHKIHGPKGVGVLWKRTGIHLEPLMHGGDQEGSLRPGTENMAGIAGFAVATRLATTQREENMAKMDKLKKAFLGGLLQKIPDVVINSPADGAPHIVNITIPDIKGEVLVHALEEAGVYLSTGSACHSHRADPSHVLLAMGRTAKEIEASLRISFSALNTEEEIYYTLESLQEAVSALQLVTRRVK